MNVKDSVVAGNPGFDWAWTVKLFFLRFPFAVAAAFVLNTATWRFIVGVSLVHFGELIAQHFAPEEE